MNPLATAFVDAMLAEQARYKIRFRTHDNDHDVWSAGDSDHYRLFTGTRADCERWIAERACQAGWRAFRAVTADWAKKFPSETGMHLIAQGFVDNFLNSIAGDDHDR